MVVLQCISLVTAAVSYPQSVIADYEIEYHKPHL